MVVNLARAETPRYADGGSRALPFDCAGNYLSRVWRIERSETFTWRACGTASRVCRRRLRARSAAARAQRELKATK